MRFRTNGFSDGFQGWYGVVGCLPANADGGGTVDVHPYGGASRFLLCVADGFAEWLRRPPNMQSTDPNL